MGSHCGRPIKKPKLSPKPKKSLSPSSSHIEKTTDPQENHDLSSPHFVPLIEPKPHLGFGSLEDVRKVYEINPEVIGKGHFSSVRKAILAGSSESEAVAFSLKSVPLHSLQPHIKDLLGQELEILRRFPHPRIVRFFEAYQDTKFVHVLLEYLPGGDLLSYLLKQPEGVISEKKAKKMMFELFCTVKYLHKNRIVHRDIKPENLLFDAGQKTLKLIDFGLSKQDEITNMKTVLGSPYYIAPEILMKRGYDKACDVWSLGILLYLILQGTPPFFEEDLHDLFTAIETRELTFIKEVSAEAKDLIQKMLRKNPSERISIDEALKHKFFEDAVAEIGELKCDENALRLVISNMRANRDLFNDQYKSLRLLFLESGFQFLDQKEQETLESFYRFFDPKLKGTVTLKAFSKGLKKLNFPLSESEISGVFHDYNSAFQSQTSKKSIGYHTLLLAMIGNMDSWLGKAFKNAMGFQCEKGMIKKLFERKLIKIPDEDFDGMVTRDIVNRIMGREEDVDEEKAAEGKKCGLMHFA